MPDVQSGAFGLAIAFVAPGIVGLWGMSLYLPTVREWFGATATAQATGAGALFVVVASLAVGLFVSGLRQEVFDQLFLTKLLKRPRPTIDESKLTNTEVLAALRFVSENLFRYYQFYSNMAFAMALTYVAWVLHGGHWTWLRTGGLALLTGAVALLILSAMYSRERYFKALSNIFGAEGSETNE